MESNEEYVLSEAERDILRELGQRAQEAASMAAAPFENQVRGILTLIVRREKLAGVWDVYPDGTKLVRHESNN